MYWIKLTELFLFLDHRGWKKPRQVVHTPLIVLTLENEHKSDSGRDPRTNQAIKQEALMFGLWFRLKVKFWLLAVHISFWLKRAIEKRAAQSVGLIGGGAMLVDRKGLILNIYLRTLDGSTAESTAFGPN
jgi:hypothetical protein